MKRSALIDGFRVKSGRVPYPGTALIG